MSGTKEFGGSGIGVRDAGSNGDATDVADEDSGLEFDIGKP